MRRLAQAPQKDNEGSVYLRECLNEARAHQGTLPLVRAFTNNADWDRSRTGETYPCREREGDPRALDPGLRNHAAGAASRGAEAPGDWRKSVTCGVGSYTCFSSQ